MASRLSPYYCPRCKAEGSYYGRLLTPEDAYPLPVCPNQHEGDDPKKPAPLDTPLARVSP